MRCQECIPDEFGNRKRSGRTAGLARRRRTSGRERLWIALKRIIVSGGILLRNFEEDDLQDLYTYASQEGVGESAGWPRHKSLRQSEKTLKDFINNKNQFAIVSRGGNRVIGHIGIHEDSENGRPDTKELGFVLNRDFWNRGIMTEAVLAVLDHLFADGIQSVYACCFQNNAASKRLIEKCGFAFERAGTYHAELLNRTFSTFEYVYTRERWQQRRGERES